MTLTYAHTSIFRLSSSRSVALKMSCSGILTVCFMMILNFFCVQTAI